MSPLEVSLKNALADSGVPDLPILIATVGLPRSGKSTWARQQSVPIVSPDSVRLALHGKPFLQEAEPWVWVQVKTMIRALFIAGHYVVILDAANTTRKRRADWINPNWRLVFKVFTVAKQTCIDRANATARPDLILVIERMYGQWERIERDEGPMLNQLIKCD